MYKSSNSFRLSGFVIIVSILMIHSLSPEVVYAQGLLQCTSDTRYFLLPEQLEGDSQHRKFTADDISVFDDEVRMQGNVVMDGDSRRIRANEILYSRKQQTVQTHGTTVFQDSEVYIATDSIYTDLKHNTLTGGSLEFRLRSFDFEEPSEVESILRGGASSIVAANDLLTFQDVRLTHCPEGNDDVLLSSSEFVIDNQARLAKLRNTVLRIKNVPVLYLPVVYLPIGEERRSGFLVPEVSYNNDDGLILAVPYYFNLAPNYDLTLTSSLTTEEIVDLFADYRHIGLNSATDFRTHWAAINKDDKRKGLYAGKLRSAWHDGDRLYTSLNIDWASEDDYVEEFPDQFRGWEYEDFLKQEAQFTYLGDYAKFSFGADQFIPTKSGLNDEQLPHERLPWTSLSHNVPLSTNANLTTLLTIDNFRHSSLAQSTRYRMNSELSGLFSKPHGSIGYQVGGQYLHFNMQDANKADAVDNTSVFAPYFSLNGKLYFDEAETQGKDRQWTLEPQFNLFVANDVDQSNLPIFDTTFALVDNYEDIYSDKLFVGGDRIEDVNHFSAGISANLYESETSRRILQLGFGKIYYPEGRSLTIEEASSRDLNSTSSSYSEWVLSVAAQGAYSAFDLVTLVDSRKDKISSTSLRYSYNFQDLHRFRSIYRYDREGAEQFGNAFEFKLNSQWNLILQNLASLDSHQSIESSLKLEHTSCCWNAGIQIKEDWDDFGKRDRSIYIYFSLNGFITN